MISEIAFDRLSHLRAFPYDRLKIYTIVSIVRIEFNSIHCLSKWSRVSQSSGSFAIVRVAFQYDRFDRLNIIWDDWDDRDNHMETGFSSSIEMKYSKDVFKPDVFKAVQSTHCTCFITAVRL